MAIIEKVSRVTDLKLMSKVYDGMKTVAAYNKKNYQVDVKKLLKGTKIANISEDKSNEDGGQNVITVVFDDGTVKNLVVYNGSKGNKGKTGEAGEDGDQGKVGTVDVSRNGITGCIDIINNNSTNSRTAAWSAYRGKAMNEALKQLTETFVTDDAYQILWNNLIYIEAEFTTEEDNQTTVLFGNDVVSHINYKKYWTYEDGENTSFYIYNPITKAYDSITADLWTEIYQGKKSGYFIASSSQLVDGTVLYLYNAKTNAYDKVTFIETTQTVTQTKTDANGDPILDAEGKEQTETVEKTQYIGDKTFKYWAPEIKAYISGSYSRSTGKYVYELEATNYEWPLYTIKRNEDGTVTYVAVKDFSTVDVTDTYTEYYSAKKEDARIPSTELAAYIGMRTPRYYTVNNGTLTEVKSIEDIDVAGLQEYYVVTYLLQDYHFEHWYHETKNKETYYVCDTLDLNGSSMKFYYYDENREYYTMKTSTHEVTNANGSTSKVTEYIYEKVAVPVWVIAEFTTTEEDEETLLLNSDKELGAEDNTVKDDTAEDDGSVAEFIPVKYITTSKKGRLYAAANGIISLHRFDEEDIHSFSDVYEDDGLVKIWDIDAYISESNITLFNGEPQRLDFIMYPKNATNKNVVISYDDEVIKFYEDGRIAAIKDNCDTEITIKALGAADEAPVEFKLNVVLRTPVKSVKLAETSKSKVWVGKTAQITAEITPDNASDKVLNYIPRKFTSLTGNNLSLELGDTFKMSKYITYNGSAYAVDEIWLDEESSGVSYKITPSEFEISGFALGNYVFSCFDKEGDEYEFKFNVSVIEPSSSYVSISSTGLVTARKPGNITIDVEAHDGFGASATYKIETITPVTKIEYNEALLTPEIDWTEDPDWDEEMQGVTTTPSPEDLMKYAKLLIGQKVDLTPKFTPENATYKNMTWTTSNNKVATVSSGVITGVGEGDAIITCKTTDGSNLEMSFRVRVDIAITNIIIEPDVLNLNVTRKAQLSATIVPDNALNATFEWKSENEEIATVDNKGIVTAVKSGLTKIYANATDGSGVSKYIDLTVSVPVTNIDLTQPTVSIGIAETTKIASVVTDSKTEEDQIVLGLNWSTSDASIATVTQDGIVTGVGVGTVTIIAAAKDGSGVVGTCLVNIIKKATSISFAETEYELTTNDILVLTPNIDPVDATNEIVRWTSSDATIATVNNGVVKPLKSGEAIITAETTDGSQLSATCKVTVQ